jgi:putative hydrolase of the HAD superfamily
MFQQIAQCTGLTPDVVQDILVREKVHQSYESGQIDSSSFYQIFQARSPHSFTLPAFLEAASDIFTPNESLFPLVRQLKEKGLRLVLLSNTSECHYNRVYTHYPTLRLLDDQVLSFEVGALKPSEQIFLEALSKAQCDPKYCFYTDDVPEFVDGARKVGLDSEIFTGVSALKSALGLRGVALQ